MSINTKKLKWEKLLIINGGEKSPASERARVGAEELGRRFRGSSTNIETPEFEHKLICHQRLVSVFDFLE